MHLRPRTSAKIRVPLILFSLAVSFFRITGLHAQELDILEPPDSSVKWVELRSERIWLYVPEQDEQLGRETLARAENAARIVSERFGWRPSRPIRLVMNDVSDEPNGFAIPFPYPQIQIFITAPREGEFLADYDDWLDMLIRHELTHIHHLDRVEGWAAIPRYIFGNAPGFGSPGASVPIFLIEGLAVWQETHPDSANKGRVGRNHDAAVRGLLRTAALEEALPAPDEVSVLGVPYPGGLGPYLYGAAFMDFLERRCAGGTLNEIVRKHSRKLIPFLIQQSISDACGHPFYDLWNEWQAGLRQEAIEEQAKLTRPAPAPLFRNRSHITSLQWIRDGLLVRAIDPDIGARTFLLDPDTGAPVEQESSSKRTPLARRGLVEPPAGNDVWLIEKASTPRPGVHFTGIHRWKGGETLPFNGGLRGFDAGVHPDGTRWVFVRNRPPVTELLLGDGEQEPTVVRPAIAGISWSSPRFSPDGNHIIVARRKDGEVKLVVLSAGEGYPEVLTFGFPGQRNTYPRPLPDGRVIFASDLGGIYNLFVFDPADNSYLQLTDLLGGAFDPALSPDGTRVGYRSFMARGQGVATVSVSEAFPVRFPLPATTESARTFEPPVPAPAEKQDYSPWGMYLPRFWLPIYAQAPNDFLLGAFTGGQDVLRRGFWSSSVYWGFNSETPRAFVTVGGHRINSLWGRPLPFVQFSRNLVSFGRTEVARIDTAGNAMPEIRDLWNDRIRVAAGFTTDAALTIAQLPFVEDSRQGLALSATTFYERRRDLDGALTALVATRPGLDISTFRALNLVGARVVAEYSWLRYAQTSLGPRMGLAISAGAEGLLKEAGSDRTGANISGDIRGYLPVPYLPRQTIALRAAAGTTFKRRIMVSTYTLGGAIGEGPAILSSGQIPLLRGYPDSAFGGDNILAFNAEYRLNLLSVHRGLWLLPLHLDQVGLVGFFDAGQTWNDRFESAAFRKGAGGETWFEGRVLYYLPMRLRLSLARGLDSGGGTEARVILGSTF